MSRTALLASFVGLFLAAHQPAAAAAAKPKAEATSCWDNAGTQLEMNQCAAADYQAADKRLNAAYQAVLCHLEAEERVQLQTAQRAWIAYRDADCAFWGGGGGSIAPMNALTCKTSVSEDRVKELDSWPPNAPRDALSPCPAPSRR